MDKTFYSVASSIARHIALVAAFGTHFANGSAVAGRTDASAAIPEKLQLLTEFFDNEVAAGRGPGGRLLISQPGPSLFPKRVVLRVHGNQLPPRPDTIFFPPFTPQPTPPTPGRR